MFIKTQDRKELINLNNIIKIGVEIGEECIELYANLIIQEVNGYNSVKLGEFKDKNKAFNELNYIQDWIEKSTKKVYEITIDYCYL